MEKNKSNRGLIASSLLMTAVAATLGFAGGMRSAAPQDPKGEVGSNPAQQRIDMIKHLQSIDKHLVTVEKSLQNLEKAASAELQLMMKAQAFQEAQTKPRPVNPHLPPSPGPVDPDKITGPR
jgi:hypothetical protein